MEQYTVKEIQALLRQIHDEHDPLLKEIMQDERKSVQQLVARWWKRKKQEEQAKRQWEAMTRYEKQLHEQGIEWIAGIDEAGRGPLAGPVVAAAVILPKDVYIPGLNDSKKLSEAKREQLFHIIQSCAISIGIGVVTAAEIDEINIYEATKKAMVKAVQQLSPQPHYLLIDAMTLPIATPQQSIIKGDANSVSIAASSIIAKVTRDHFMKQLAKRYPQYGFDKNMGYGTRQHLEAIRTYGAIEEHRRSFSPVKEIIAAADA
ncbi:ribonuclease HII [Saccharococcus thermophilus]|uniref:Ribonuclease HII n=1 Tax=Saccharococcus thermophilus TaxID=29396 RepID=A0A846MCM6_9BACL|nr:ribonuclease HII [Saccharococcus thermophilus]NIK14227.1 ribonuclease HII [Saccharococcus thermophilus]